MLRHLFHSLIIFYKNYRIAKFSDVIFVNYSILNFLTFVFCLIKYMK
jgi:hypothetical protein